MPLVGLRSLVRKSLVPGFLTGVALLAAACGGELPQGNQPGNLPAPGLLPVEPVTVGGQQTMNLYILTGVIAVIVFFLVEGLLLFITIRFRRREGDDELPPQIHGSNRLEILWTIVPAITVTALFAAVLITLNQEQVDAAAPPAVTVDVTGFQWQWTFEYPDQGGIKLTGRGREGPVMAVPVNEPIRIRLQSSDVIHSFYIPQSLYKKDVVPGRINEFQMTFAQIGTFSGQCAEFCGLGHADMHFSVQSMSRADFDAWVLRAQQQPTPGPSQAAAPPGAQTIALTSVSITQGFDPNALTATANQPWTVSLTNADPAAPHDFSIRGANPDGSDWQGDPNAQPGGGTATYNPPSLAAGTYEFYCSIHPNMKGSLNVQ